MLYEVLYEMAFTNEQENAEDLDTMAPHFFRLDGEVAIGEQGLQQYSRSLAIFEICFEPREGHEWMVHSWNWAEGTGDTFVFHPSDEL
jgi:hypothetical protein